MNGACEQLGSFSVNRNNKNTYSLNQKVTVAISWPHSEGRRLGNFDTPREY